jgi:hypothetical protein
MLIPKVREVFSYTLPGRLFSRAYYGESLVWLGQTEEVSAILTDDFVETALRISDRTGVESLAEMAFASGHQPLARGLLDRYANGPQRFVHGGLIGFYLRNSIDYALALAHRTVGAEAEANAAIARAVAFATEHGSPQLEARMLAVASRWSARPQPSLEVAHAGVPRLEPCGATWEVEFAGRIATVRANKGITMIAELIRRPGVEVHVLDLVHLDGDRARVDEGDAGELLDAKARAEYRRRAEAIADELAEAERFNDVGRSERLREELDAIATELSRGIGLSGAPRRAVGAAERARVNVRKRLRHAIAVVGEVHPELGRHLDATIRTGIFCEYRPL